jgi:CheY-like chemotaxis protein/nitrogen-specific signal transduction histidine kinase
MVLLIRSYLFTEDARRKSHEAQLEAERLAAAKTGFLSRVSHELRTPLNAILGFGQLLELGDLDLGERETLDQMLSGGRHLLAIVDDLLDLSRVDAGELRLSLEPVQIADVLSESRVMMSRTAATGAVGVRTRSVSSDLYVKADRQRLMQILLNLLSNAVKYTGRGGNVVLSVKSTPRGRARIEIADTGIGIAPENIDRLFTPFERLDAASRGIDGTGLGLAVAKGLVEAMDGTLGVSSKLGAGTTVWLELPLSTEADLALEPAPASLPADAGPAVEAEGDGAPRSEADSISVLYIEDNPSNVRLVEKIFATRSEITLGVAREGMSGLALARQLRPDVILLDLHLPDMSGEQVLAALLNDPETAKIPVIIVSADASPTRAKRLRAAGAAGYLTKPFDIDRLTEAVTVGGTSPIGPGDGAVGDQLLDLPMVESLRVLAANPAVGPVQIGEMLNTFHADAEAMFSVVRDALAAGDLNRVTREAHRLVGAAGAYGAGRFCRVCRELEDHAKAGRLAEARALEPRLGELLELTWTALQAAFANELRHPIPG